MTKTVKVTFKTEHDKSGNAKLVTAKPIIKKVQNHYMDGRISDSSGSVWEVIKNDNQKESTYVTVKPTKKEVN